MNLTPTIRNFQDAIAANPRGLAQALQPIRSRTTVLHFETRDSHAAYCVEAMAHRAGLRVLLTLTDDSGYHVTIRGFAK